MYSPHNPLKLCVASRNNQVQNTKGNVSEFIFQEAIMLFNPVRTHVVMQAQSINAIHMSVVLPINVGNAQPTRIPLKPHRPHSPSSLDNLSIYPVIVEQNNPKMAPIATSILPSMAAPAVIPRINIIPVHELF